MKRRLGAISIVLVVFTLAFSQVMLERPAAGEAQNRSTQQSSTQQHPRNAVQEDTGTFENPIPLAVRDEIKVVYQIKTPGMKKGVAAGLHYLNKLAKTYDQLGIDESDRQIVGVFHGDAGYFLLRDPAYQKEEKGTEKNPNRQLVQELLDRGVRLELCKSTMQSHGWTGEDVLPGVKIVVGAYPRIIDLQLQGYAYIRF